jgi:hypothetical protein
LETEEQSQQLDREHACVFDKMSIESSNDKDDLSAYFELPLLKVPDVEDDLTDFDELGDPSLLIRASQQALLANIHKKSERAEISQYFIQSEVEILQWDSKDIAKACPDRIFDDP